MAEGEMEYESDPEEAKISLAMRRREASDDEEKEDDDDDDCVDKGSTKPRRTVIVSEYESDGQGAASDCDDEESEMDENDEYEERVGEAEGKADGNVAVEAVVVEFDSIEGEKGENEPVDEEYYVSHAGERGEEDDKKENEPFSVPTAGAFYMHDDRFRDRAAGRHRRTPGGSKLWESKDDKKWGHDKFEEMTMQGRRYNKDRRGTRGHFRAQDGSRGEGNGYSHPNMSKAASFNNSDQNATSNNNVPKSVRGRCPRRYLPAMANDGETLMQKRLPGKSVEIMPYHSYPGRVRSSVVESNAFDSSLSSASPPFHSLGCSPNEGLSTMPKKYSQKSMNQNLPPGAVREKNVPDSISMDKLQIDVPFSRKPLNKMQLPQSRGVDQVAYQNLKPCNNANFRVSPPTHKSPSVEGQLSQQLPDSGSHVLFPPALSVHSFKSEETVYLSETASAGKGKGDLQASLSASFPYHADQNFSGTPAFFPLMQFGGQHHGGVGVPSLGMAFPGYVARHGLSNSEMTWLPVLAGGAAEAALGATYRSSPPYLPAAGPPASHHHLQSSSFSIPRKENIIGRPTAGGLKSSQRPAKFVNDGFGQLKNKPRRYTEMKFDQ